MKANFIYVFLITIFIVSCDFSSSTRHQSNYGEVEYFEEKCEEECPDCDGRGMVSVSCHECGGAGEKKQYTSGTRPKDCPTCFGTGVARCNTCNGNDRCRYCNGRGANKCTVCHGYGVIVFDRNDPDTWIDCSTCDGKGFAQCYLCGGSGECTSCNDGLTNCSKCWGSGHYGSESYYDTRKIKCSSCNGSGRHREYCDNCNGTGYVIVTKVVEKCN